MKIFWTIIIVNVLVVIGVIGFVVWQSLDSGSPLGLIILAVILLGFFGFFLYIGGLRAIFRWYIVSSGERARAVILERRLGNLEMYAGGNEYQPGKLTSQQVVLKLEVHSSNGPTYIAEDRFWAPAWLITRLIPGSEMQVAIARNNPKWVASLTETLAALPRP